MKKYIAASLVVLTASVALSKFGGSGSGSTGGGGGSGTVTSAGLALTGPLFTVSGSPVTTAGTLTGTINTQLANLVFAGPGSGGAAAPTFRSLVALDIPNLSAAKITSGQGTLSTSTTGVTVGTGTNALLTGATVDIQTASGSQPGLLSAANWTTFNSKVTSVSGTAPVVSSGGATPAISMAQADSTTNGYLEQGDWTAFNDKANPFLSNLQAPTALAVDLRPSGSAATSLGSSGFNFDTIWVDSVIDNVTGLPAVDVFNRTLNSTDGTAALNFSDDLKIASEKDFIPSVDAVRSLGVPSFRWNASIDQLGFENAVIYGNSVIPDTPSQVDLGTVSNYFNDIYAVGLKDIAGDGTQYVLNALSRSLNTPDGSTVIDFSSDSLLEVKKDLQLSGHKALKLANLASDFSIALTAPSGLTASYGLEFPADDGTTGQVLTTDGDGLLTWETFTPGTGDVVGPASAVDSHLCAFSGSTGKLIQDGGATIAQVRDRSTQTGTQLASTISDFNTAVATTAALKANNLSDLASASTARTNLGLGSIATHATTEYAATANNLSDLASAPTARVNLVIDKRTAVSNADYSVLSTDAFVAQTGTLSAVRTFTLPAASSINAGQSIIVADESGTAGLTNYITVARAGADTINGATTANIQAPYGMRRLISDGVSKWTFDGGVLRASNNLSDLLGPLTTARTNIGLGTGDSPTFAGLSLTGAETITAQSANALAVGRVGTTNPAFNVDSSTASSATGVKITALIAGGGAFIDTTSSATNEELSVSSKGTSSLNLVVPGNGTMKFNANGATRLSLNSASAVFSPTTSATASTVRFSFATAADLNMTAGAESPAAYFNLSSTREHGSNNTIALQRDFRIAPSTHTFTAATGTITNAAGLAIDGPPNVTTNGTATNSSALYIPTKALTNVTNAYGLNVTATTGATNNYVAKLMGGNVGINIASPTALLHVDGGNGVATALKITEGTTGGTTSTDGFDVGGDASGNAELRQRENLALNFFTNNTQRAAIAAGGQLSAQLGGTTTLMGVNTGSYTDTTTTGNTAATETDAFSHSIAASTLAANGDAIEFSSAGTFATSISTDKRVKVKFGATTIFDSGALAITTSASWSIKGQCIRTGAATQKCFVMFTNSSSTLSGDASYSTAAETLSGAVTMKLTVQGTLGNDVVGEMYKETFLPGT